MKSANRVFPSGCQFQVPADGSLPSFLKPADVILLPYMEQRNLKKLTDPELPWYMQRPPAVQTPVTVYRCPTDPSPEVVTSTWIGNPGIPAGDKFALSSYALNIGLNDALAFGPGYGPRPTDRNSGVFAFQSQTKLKEIQDGISHTIAWGEAASGVPMVTGPPGSTTPIPNDMEFNMAFHPYIYGFANPDDCYGAGFRYAGGFCSTVERLNKRDNQGRLSATDSFYLQSDGTSHFDTRPSWNGGPHWVSSFRSLHPAGANFLFCDGHTKFIVNEVDFVDFTTDSKAQPGVYQMMSTIQGDETIPGESF